MVRRRASVRASLPKCTACTVYTRAREPHFGDPPCGVLRGWRGENEKRLFVVNHPTTGEEFIEIFSVGESGALSHLATVSFEAMHSPNDVVAVGPRQFYATNDRGYEHGVISTIEAYFGLPLSSVVYFDGERGQIIKKGFSYANGINISSDGSTVYVAEFLKRRISIFDRDEKTATLSKRRMINVDTGPDNIEIDSNGDLWIAGHPKVFEFLKHAKDSDAISPSHVVRVNVSEETVDDILISTAGEINGSSVGAANDSYVLVGAVFDEHILVCPR